MIQEICKFLLKNGGAYQKLHPLHIQRIQDCIDKDLFLLHKNESGSIDHFMAFWLVDDDDLANALLYKKPLNVTTGRNLVSIDFSSDLGRKIPKVLHTLASKYPEVDYMWYEHFKNGQIVKWENVNGKWQYRRL